MTENEIEFANRVIELIDAYNDGTLKEETVKLLTPLNNDDYSELICEIVRTLPGRLREQLPRFEWDAAIIKRWCDALRNHITYVEILHPRKVQNTTGDSTVWNSYRVVHFYRRQGDSPHSVVQLEFSVAGARRLHDAGAVACADCEI